jgi:tRNA threonylcarbamoyladenosine biosynthesis protein TsaE
MLRILTSSVEETQRLAAALEPHLDAGDLLLLSGDLGAGKTAFVQGLAAAIGVTNRVTSPTFVVAQTYQGRLRLHHLDAYRIETPAQIMDLDLPRLLDDAAVTVIEWGDVLLSALPQDFLRIRITFGFPEYYDTVRIFEFDPVGPAWSRSRMEALSTAFKQLTEES